MWLIFKLKEEFEKIKESLKELNSTSLNNKILIDKNQEEIKESVSRKEIHV